MRKFNYTEDHNIIGTTINGYITQLEKELKLLNEMEDNILYNKALTLVEEFKKKYSNLGYISSLILNDLLKPDNVEYCFNNGKYPKDASIIGMKFEQDLKRIFIIEEELKTLALERWSQLTKFDEIENGKDFMVAVHASSSLPGSKDCPNYKNNDYSKQYLSCSLISGMELNPFNGIKTLFIMNVNSENYISSSSFDSVTKEVKRPGFNTLKEINENGVIHYVDVGYTHDYSKGVTTISTPKLVEKLSVQREIDEGGILFEYSSLTNEVVLDRTKTNVVGAILLSNGCDLLLDEYMLLKKNNIRFKCINKGLYKRKNNMDEYDLESYKELLKQLEQLENTINTNNFDLSILLDYYNDVIVKMDYSDEIKNVLIDVFKKYIDIPSFGTR